MDVHVSLQLHVRDTRILGTIKMNLTREFVETFRPQTPKRYPA